MARVTDLLIVSDSPLRSLALRSIVTADDALRVCGETDASGALAGPAGAAPDVAILALEGTCLARVRRALDERYPGVRLLLVLRALDPDALQAAAPAGVCGLVTERMASAELLDAIRHLRDGRPFIGSDLWDRLFHLTETGRERWDAVFTLSEREREVLRLCGLGYRPGRIAEELFISPKTVSAHRETIKKKLNLDSASELDRLARKWVRGEVILRAA